MTVHLRPQHSPSREARVAQFCAAVRQAADQKPDIICLPEGITVVGAKKSFVGVSESIPGPTTETLGTPVVTAEVHLDRKIHQPWIGDMSTRTWKERRGDLPK